MQWRIVLGLLTLFATGSCRRHQKRLQDRRGHGVSVRRGDHAHRQGEARARRPCHLFNDLPATRVHRLDPRRGQGLGPAGDRLRRQRGAFRCRARTTRSPPPSASASRTRSRSCKDERAVLQPRSQAAEAQKALISNLAQLPTRPAPANGSATPSPTGRQLFGLIGQRIAEAQKAILDTQIKIREVDRQIKRPRRQARVAGAHAAGAHRGQGVRQRGRARSMPTSSSATRSATPRGRRSTMRACRPAPRPRRPSCSSCVAPASSSAPARSGTSVALALSTARPGAGTAAPQLGPMTVDYEPDSSSVPRRAAPSAARRAACRAIAAPRLPGADASNRRRAAKSVAAPATKRRHRSRRRRSRPSTPSRAGSPCRPRGRPSACRSTRQQLDPALTVRTVPKRDQKAFLYAKVTMARGTPILPGQVSLFRDGTFVGNGRLPLLPPGEEHELGFGVDDAVRVRHAIAEEKRGETGIITSSKTDTRNYRITVKNLHERAIPVTVSTRSRCRRMAISRSSCWARRRRPSATWTTSAGCSPGTWS